MLKFSALYYAVSIHNMKRLWALDKQTLQCTYICLLIQTAITQNYVCMCMHMCVCVCVYVVIFPFLNPAHWYPKVLSTHLHLTGHGQDSSHCFEHHFEILHILHKALCRNLQGLTIHHLWNMKSIRKLLVSYQNKCKHSATEIKL